MEALQHSLVSIASSGSEKNLVGLNPLVCDASFSKQFGESLKTSKSALLLDVTSHETDVKALVTNKGNIKTATLKKEGFGLLDAGATLPDDLCLKENLQFKYKITNAKWIPAPKVNSKEEQFKQFAKSYRNKMVYGTSPAASDMFKAFQSLGNTL